MELIINGIYNYGFFKNVRLIACDIDKSEVILKDKQGNEKYVYLSLFRKYGKLVSKEDRAL